MTRRTFIVGVGCTKFIKPRAQRTAEDMGLEAATKALLDAGVTYDAVQHAFVGYCYGDSCTGQRALYGLGMTGIPITNVNNNCATGSVALYHANTYVKSGVVECALALGFEQMSPGSLGTNFPDRPPPLAVFSTVTHEIEEAQGGNTGPMAPRMFSDAAQEYFDKYGASKKHLAMIASKNHKHSTKNPYSQFQNGWTVEQVLKAQDVTKQSTKLMCCPTSDGAACCIVASESFVRAHKLENQAIEIVAQGLGTDEPSAFETKSAMELVGFSMTRRVADEVFRTAGVSRDDVGVVELHDCFAANELVTYDALRLCKEGEAHKFVERGDNTYGGKYVVNPSGGLEAKGHPLGATGLGMHFYITTQLRNWAGPMQVPHLSNKYGLVHNLGLGGACVVSLLKRPDFYKDGGEDGRSRLGYNHAHECRQVTMADLDKVKSKKFSPTVLAHAKL
ncbi:thiolase [Exidia glandulosa HHB12029]|uniref:Thiolase n=1 Tax=Exidia glandulosa HHB12029 TaxID=1314781 RepID=A0A165PG57_EXIGL|nr:thiolase [Exidia glandulosa HHB12029]